MNSNCKKLLSAVLMAAMVLPAMSCGKTKESSKDSDSGKSITADNPWYEAKEYTVDLGLDKSRDVSYCYSEFIGGDEDYVFIKTTAEYSHPGRLYPESGDSVETVCMADRNTGETIKTIDLFKLLPEGCWPSGANYRKGVLEVTSSIYNEEQMTYVTKVIKYDLTTEKIIDESESEEEFFQKDTYDVGDYSLDVISQWTDDGNNYYKIDITSPDGSTKSAELKEEGRALYVLPILIPVSKTQVLAYTMADNDNLFYKIDLENGNITKQDPNDYAWLDLDRYYSFLIGADGNTYTTSGTGVFKVNTDKKCIEEVLNYSWCDINRKKITNLAPGYISADSILLCSETLSSGKFGFHDNLFSSSYTFVSLKKTANPHAGKQILEMYVPYGWVADAVYDKIVEFNNTNGKYFIEITDRYTQEYNIEYSEDQDETSMAVIDSLSNMGNKLAMDIINGNGPDIFYDAYYFGPLNYKDHLADLTPYIGELDKDKYFANFVDLSKTDGKIYEMPLAVGAYGIATDSSHAGKTGVGLTTEEYEKFLNETLNGEDILTQSQPYYFVELFNAMKNRFIKDGKADFTSEDFAVLAKFVKDNVRERALPEDYESDGEDWYSLTPAILTTSSDYWLYFENTERLIGDGILLGLPSSDGRGPIGTKPLSIAVSAHAADIDACGEFIKTLLSDDVQYQLGLDDYLPLNREAFRKAGLEAVEYFNSVSISPNYGPDGIAPKNRVTFTEAHIDTLEKTLLSCTGMLQEDPDIAKILIEEMPAYFAGQKELSEVAKIAQDRVQKVLGERG